MDNRTLFEKIFGYCPACDLWFCSGVKRRRFNAEYADEGDNYITVCKSCFEEVEAIMDSKWNEYNNERLGGYW